jgi:hypothetical protein
MFRRASLGLVTLLVVHAAAIPKSKDPTSAAKVSSFSFCARPILDSYTQQRNFGFNFAPW